MGVNLDIVLRALGVDEVEQALGRIKAGGQDAGDGIKRGGEKATRALKDTEKAAKDTEASVKTLGETGRFLVERMGGWDGVARGITEASTALRVMTGGWADSARERANAETQIENILRAQGRLNDITKQYSIIKDVAARGHFPNTDELLQGVRVLDQFGTSTQHLGRLLEGITIQSRNFGKDFGETTETFGEAYATGQTSGLTEVGLNIDADKAQQISEAYAKSAAEGQAMFMQVVGDAIKNTSGTLEGSIDRSTALLNDGARAAKELEVALGKGSKDAEDNLNGASTALVKMVAVSPQLAYNLGAIGTYAGTAGQQLGGLAQIGLQTFDSLTAVAGHYRVGVTGIPGAIYASFASHFPGLVTMAGTAWSTIAGFAGTAMAGTVATVGAGAAFVLGVLGAIYDAFQLTKDISTMSTPELKEKYDKSPYLGGLAQTLGAPGVGTLAAAARPYFGWDEKNARKQKEGDDPLEDLLNKYIPGRADRVNGTGDTADKAKAIADKAQKDIHDAMQKAMAGMTLPSAGIAPTLGSSFGSGSFPGIMNQWGGQMSGPPSLFAEGVAGRDNDTRVKIRVLELEIEGLQDEMESATLSRKATIQAILKEKQKQLSALRDQLGADREATQNENERKGYLLDERKARADVAYQKQLDALTDQLDAAKEAENKSRAFAIAKQIEALKARKEYNDATIEAERAKLTDVQKARSMMTVAGIQLGGALDRVGVEARDRLGSWFEGDNKSRDAQVRAMMAMQQQGYAFRRFGGFGGGNMVSRQSGSDGEMWVRNTVQDDQHEWIVKFEDLKIPKTNIGQLRGRLRR